MEEQQRTKSMEIRIVAGCLIISRNPLAHDVRPPSQGATRDLGFNATVSPCSVCMPLCRLFLQQLLRDSCQNTRILHSLNAKLDQAGAPRVMVRRDLFLKL